MLDALYLALLGLVTKRRKTQSALGFHFKETALADRWFEREDKTKQPVPSSTYLLPELHFRLVVYHYLLRCGKLRKYCSWNLSGSWEQSTAIRTRSAFSQIRAQLAATRPRNQLHTLDNRTFSQSSGRIFLRNMKVKNVSLILKILFSKKRNGLSFYKSYNVKRESLNPDATNVKSLMRKKIQSNYALNIKHDIIFIICKIPFLRMI